MEMELDKRLEVMAYMFRVPMYRFEGVDLLAEYDLIMKKESKLASIVRQVISLTVAAHLKQKEEKHESR